MIFTSSRPRDCPACQQRKPISRGRTHIVRGSGLQVDSSREEVLQHSEDTIILEEALKASQKSQEKLDFSPIARLDMFLSCISNALQDLCRKLRFLRIEYQYDRCHKGNLQRLLDGPVAHTSVISHSSVIQNTHSCTTRSRNPVVMSLSK